MTPTTLYSDKKLFASFYKNAFSRLKGVAMLYGIIMFIVFPMFYFIAVGEAMDRYALGKRYYGFNGNPEMYPAVAAVFFFAVAVGAIISLIAISNSFMHSKKAVDVFHALPVKRPAMLLANFAAVSSWMIILEAVCYLVVGITSIFTVPIPIIPLIAEFLRVVVLTLTITAMASFCSVCCNTVLDSAIFTAAFNAIVPAYAFLIYALFATFIEGFASNRIVMVNSVWFSPVGMLYQTFFAEDLPFTVLHGIIYLAFTAALMALSCKLYVKRKSERAQSNNINSVIYRFIILAASIGGGAFFGFVISEMFGWGSYNREIGPVTLMSCLFTAVIYLIFSTVTSRKVNHGKKGFMWLGAGIALTAALFISVNTGFFGMESYVPDLNDIQSVKIYYAGDYDRVTYYLREPDGTYRYRYGDNEGVVFEDIDEIELIRNMHETIVENLDGVTENTPWDYHSVEVEYTLNNGRRVM
ncbi:MAG: hypothetical protein IJ339_00420, partial [Oscillospiraceae bacterium]|nr:hypothetical protein [Oscillospiraceae bacterium]